VSPTISLTWRRISATPLRALLAGRLSVARPTTDKSFQRRAGTVMTAATLRAFLVRGQAAPGVPGAGTGVSDDSSRSSSHDAGSGGGGGDGGGDGSGDGSRVGDAIVPMTRNPLGPEGRGRADAPLLPLHPGRLAGHTQVELTPLAVRHRDVLSSLPHVAGAASGRGPPRRVSRVERIVRGPRAPGQRSPHASPERGGGGDGLSPVLTPPPGPPVALSVKRREALSRHSSTGSSPSPPPVSPQPGPDVPPLDLGAGAGAGAGGARAEGLPMTSMRGGVPMARSESV
jgi:hypothetical protein